MPEVSLHRQEQIADDDKGSPDEGESASSKFHDSYGEREAFDSRRHGSIRSLDTLRSDLVVGSLVQTLESFSSLF